MLGKVKKITAIVLVATFLVSMFAIATSAAEPEKPNASVYTSDYSVSGDNSFGELISDKISGSVIEPSENENGGSRITELTIEGKTATVEYESTVDCTILVAVYDETTKQMLASGKSETLKSGNSVNIEIVTDQMPEYFIAKAFILDQNNAPLSSAFSTSFYTEAIQKVNNLKATDFDEKRVFNLDDDENTNFAVYSESTKVIEYKEDCNIPVVADEENGKYVFSNATADLTSLSQGDIFSYNYGDSIIIVKVDTISVDGDTVTITETDTELEEVFDYVKIDMSQGVEDCEVDNSSPQNDAEYVERKKESPAVSSNSFISSGSVHKDFNIDPDALEFDLLDNSVIRGTVYFDVGIKAKIYLSFDECYVDFALDYKIGYSVSINAEIEEKTIELTSLSFRPVTGVKISFVPKLIFSASASMALDMSVGGTFGFCCSTDDGFSNKSSGPSTHSEIKLEGEAYFGIALEPSISVISKKVAKISTEARAGLHFEAELSTNREDDEAILHECKECASGKISIDIGVSAEAKFFGSKKLKLSGTIIEASYDLCEFYYSFDFDEFDWTSCPHLKYLVNVTVTKDGVPYPDATVMVYGDRYAENMGETDENGSLSFYLPAGSYMLSVDEGEAGFVVYKKGADVALNITTEPETQPTTDPDSKPTEPTEPSVTGSGKCGEKCYWELLDDGTLTVTGIGEMYKFRMPDNVPWHQFRTSITSVRIGKGVTSIGDNSFYDCHNLEYIAISGSVQRLGNVAFKNCVGLTEINIPDSVTAIGNGAFNGCSGLAELDIPDSVTEIGYGAFCNCSKLKSIYLPTSKGFWSQYGSHPFIGCDSLKDISISPDDERCYSEDGILYYKDTQENEIVCYPPGKTSESYSIPNGITYIRPYAFSNSKLKNITIPDTVRYIGYYAFENCKNIVDIDIPDSVDTISDHAFTDCSNLKKVKFSNGTSYISGHMFSNCTSLESFTIPVSIGSIGSYAFENCTKLKSIIIPERVSTIDYYAFSYCTSLKTIYFNGNAPYSLGTTAFEGVSATAFYPADNLSWTSNKLLDYGGAITWIAYGESVTVVASYKTASSSSQSLSTDADASIVNAEYSKAANADYIVAVVRNKEAEDVLSADNLLYINQVTADNYGKISVSIPVPDDAGDYEILIFGPEKTVTKGDVNGDGSISIDDATDIQKYAADILTFDGDRLTAADVDGDGKVTIDDVTMIQKYLADMIPSLG